MKQPTHQQTYATAIQQARQAGYWNFLSWFNRENSHTMEQLVTRGYWDFALHMLTPAVCRFMNNPEEKIALEIGYGGGRLLNAACSFFQLAIGIDIHDEQESVTAFLKSQGKTNFRLLTTSGHTIDVEHNSIDFVYSFIVLQHLTSIEMFRSYIHETARTLKPGGVAQLYFGNYARLHPFHQITHFLHGYRAVANKPANHVTLMLRLPLVRKLCQHAGLHIVETGTSFYNAPNGYPHRQGGQRYVTATKRI